MPSSTPHDTCSRSFTRVSARSFFESSSAALRSITRGIQALGAETIQRIDAAISAFEGFTPENDPYGEHDFGSVEVQGKVIFFKIDYYDLDLLHLSPDLADPAVTRRVMTIMPAEEY
jgi:Protein of unknown function (DUF3768)